jgi:hypothetical protein
MYIAVETENQLFMKNLLSTKHFVATLVVAFFTVINVFGQNAGAIDTTFNSSDIGFGFGNGASNEVIAAAVQNDGKIIIGGGFNGYNGSSVNRITRINTDGKIDNDF